MAMRMTADDQFRFLLSCVKWSNNGKVDFTEVARECGVVSKGAAAKRYERMLKTHGVHPSGTSVGSSFHRRSSFCSNTSRNSWKRRFEEFSPQLKTTELEEKKPRISKPPLREPFSINVKQEPWPVPHHPYLYQPVLPQQQHRYVQRPMPYRMAQGLNLMQQPIEPFSGHATMGRPPHNNQQMLPSYHAVDPSFAIPQQTHSNVPPPEQHSQGFARFNDFCAQDFANCGSFETLLHGGPQASNTNFDTDPSQYMAGLSPFEQTNGLVQGEPSTFKSEPLPAHGTIIPDTENIDVTAVGTNTGPEANPISPAMTDTIIVDPHPPVKTLTNALESSQEVKRERKESCVFITD